MIRRENLVLLSAGRRAGGTSMAALTETDNAGRPR